MVHEDATRANWENLANAIVLSAIKDFRTEYKKLLKNPNDATYKHQMEFVMNMLDMLEMYRVKVRDMEIKQKRYGVFIQYPTGYDFDSPIY